MRVSCHQVITTFYSYLVNYLFFTMSSASCPVCQIVVLDSDNGIACDLLCKRWFHIDCVRMSKSEYSKYASDSKKKWFCNRVDCTSVDDNPLVKLSNQLSGLIESVSKLATKDEVNSLSNGIDKLRESIETRLASVEARVDDLEVKLNSLQAGENAPAHCLDDVISEISDRNRRALNVIVYKLPESRSKDLNARINHDKGQLAELGQAIGIAYNNFDNIKLFRIGRPNKNNVRPLKIIFGSAVEVNSFLDKFSKAGLKDTDNKFSLVTVSRDRTVHERKYLNSLRAKLNDRIKLGERDLTIRYRNGIPSIVSLSKND